MCFKLGTPFNPLAYHLFTLFYIDLFTNCAIAILRYTMVYPISRSRCHPHHISPLYSPTI